MQTTTLYPVPDAVAKAAHIDAETYTTLYEQSISDPDTFWGQQAEQLDWHTRWKTVSNCSFKKDDVRINWFEGGTLNVAENCIDRHLAERADQPAIIFEPDNPADDSQIITYAMLHQQVCRTANMLKSLGVKQGDRVTIYLPMIPEAAYAMLACARIGAVHSVVFGGFSPTALRERINNCQSSIVITADEGVRGGRTIPLKANVDEACNGTDVTDVLMVKRTGADVEFVSGRDIWWDDAIAPMSDDCPATPFDAENPLFVLYTSGSTGKPKGLMHSSAGYLLYSMLTFKYVFDYQPGEVYWCTADVGWITGHSYILYGPLAAGATTVMFEGTPMHPDPSRFWQIVDKHNVASFYTAPTAIRLLMREGDDFVTQSKRSSLRVLGSVGEPINPEAWKWYHNVVGNKRCQVVDTWWQTETGGHMLTPLPGAIPTKPGSATVPFFGVEPALIDEHQTRLEGKADAALCIAQSWPGQARTIWGDHDRFVETYFSAYPGYYFSGDAALRDADDYYWIGGRMDDVLNVSGHRLGTAEVESSLVAHSAVTEAAVVGYPHDIKGESIYAYVILAHSAKPSDELITDLRNWVRKDIGPIATPEKIHIAAAIPKTRSGKIMRRILRKIAAGEINSPSDYEKLGDTSTLINPEVIDQLVEGQL